MRGPAARRAAALALVVLAGCVPSPQPSSSASATGSAPASTSPASEPARAVGALDADRLEFVPAGGGVQVRDAGADAVRVEVRLEEADWARGIAVELGPPGVAVDVGAGLARVSEHGRLVALVAPPTLTTGGGAVVPVAMALEGRLLVLRPRPAQGLDEEPRLTLWAGLRLVEAVERGESEGGLPSSSVARTAFGHALLEGALGASGARAAFEQEGWAQAVALQPELAERPSLRQQFDCHVLGAPAKRRWNLEADRPDFPGWLDTALLHRCNWTDDDVPSRPS